jgi:hypothetical protein
MAANAGCSIDPFGLAGEEVPKVDELQKEEDEPVKNC